MSIKETALQYLYRELKAAKIAYGRAETRPGVTAEELANIEKKIAVFDWLIPVATRTDDEGGEQ